MNSLAGNVKLKPKYVRSPILNSIDPNINNDRKAVDHEPICNISDLQSLNLLDDEHGESESVLLLDDSENLRMNTEASFLAALNIPPNEKVKVVSIFGNTGEGKSYTLNEVFFNGDQVFRTSPSQTSCTLGVWAKYHPTLKLICLDTEGALGISKKENQRIRLHLKVLAVSDIVIYRTRAERLHRDMYSFLGDASKAYTDHFSAALKKALSKNAGDQFSSPIGPGVIVFHETRLTEPLPGGGGGTQSAEHILQSTFAELGLPLDAFSSLKYVGVRTMGGARTSFAELRAAVTERLESTEVRTRRDARYVYLTLKSLNEKFNNKLSNATPQMYLPAFFTCPEKCESCNRSCYMSVGHKEEGEPHQSKGDCTFQHQYQNNVFLCKACHKNGVRNIVKPSYQTMTDSSWTGYFNYVWSGYVIECSRCGEIYRSRQHWYGNKDPEDMAVRTEVVHVWPGESSLFGSQNPGQRIIDGVTSITGALASAGSQPTRLISDWAADRIAPSYWRANNEIAECFKCESRFGEADRKHHCRACGEGFCEGCSTRRRPVPDRGWRDPVRVCDGCWADHPPDLDASGGGAVEGEAENRARQIGESVFNSLSAVKSVFNIPKGFIKDTARPAYWMPDSECASCAVCAKPFGELRALHHCRECGKGVCDECSPARKPVPLRGWQTAVRVCDGCR